MYQDVVCWTLNYDCPCSQNYAFTYVNPGPVVAIPIEDQTVQMQINLSPPTDSVEADPNYCE